MTLEELKYVLDQMYGFDISRRTRARAVVYAKKVFIQLAKTYGYDWKDMKDIVKLQHDNCIFHYKSFGDIKPIDLTMYNACIDYFNLPMNKIPTVESINSNPVMEEVLYKIKALGLRDVKYFNANVLDPFLSKLKKEKELNELIESRYE